MNDSKAYRCKGRFPFPLGTTSYILPDDIVPNVQVLAPLVDDIELVLFESPDASNIPSPDDIQILADIGQRFKTGYTVHLPTDRRAGAVNRTERRRFCDAAQRIIARCMPLNPRAWILHLDGIDRNAKEREVRSWAERCSRTLGCLIDSVGQTAKVAIENLGYPWYWHQGIASQAGTSLCCDVGHLWRYFKDSWREHASAMLPRTSVIHLYGVDCHNDHLSLAAGNKAFICQFLRMVYEAQYAGVMTLEVFNESDFISSMEVVTKLWEELHL